MGPAERLRVAAPLAQAILRDPYRKPLGRMLVELTAMTIRERQFPLAYLTSLVYKRSAGDPRDYISERDIRRIQRELFSTDSPDRRFLDKVLFAEIAERAGIPSPVTLTVLEPDGAGSVEQLAGRLASLREKSSRRSIFLKPVDAHSGEGAYRIDDSTAADRLLEIADRIRARRYIIQETLEQHPDVARVNPAAINCLRVHTYRAAGSDPVVLSTVMRFGVAGSVIDAPSTGGVFVPVDVETGRCVGNARTHALPRGGVEFVHHPDSGVAFDGLQLPDWDQAVAACLHAAATFDAPVVGWDVAFTTDGPVIPEGNTNPHLRMAQVAEGGLRSSRFWPVIAPHVQRGD